MKEYTLFFHNDMEHLLIEDYETLPNNITQFAYNKIQNKLLYATDNSNVGCRFFILLPGMNPRWTYYLDNISITLDYSKLDKYDSRNMILLKKKKKN